MRFAEVVATSEVVAATSSRTAKRDAIAVLLRQLSEDEVEPVVDFLVGEPRQGRIGIGWRTFASARPDPASEATLQVAEVDEAISALAGLAGAGSGTARRELLGDLLGQATEAEAAFLARLFGGELRQGALEGVMVDAVAAAAEVPATAVRRAVMLGGRLDATARAALTGGRAALEQVGLQLGRPVQPMLASTAASVAEAVGSIGLASVEWKLDGIRIQVHRHGDQVRVWTRNLNEITDRVPGVVRAVEQLPRGDLVLDGEAIGLDATGRPRLFQDTVSWRGRKGDATDEAVEVALDEQAQDADAATQAEPDLDAHLRPFFFDLLHHDGTDLVDLPLSERVRQLALVAGDLCMPGVLTDDPAAAEVVLAESLAAGHEGVVVKAAGSSYEAGRRGKAWRKVKPVHTLDLVVLAAEWGHGRRRGWLSNLHLGARAEDGSFVMVGKTFKGLTDELLRWQTERFLELAVREEHWDGPGTGVVWLRPEQVVEVAVDGVQRSTRYPGGVALRFARVVRYRDDKSPAEADLIDTVRALGNGG
jgi:DNA ligase-1